MSKITIEFDLNGDDTKDDVTLALNATNYIHAIDDIDQNIFRHLIKYGNDEMIDIALGRMKSHDAWDGLLIDEVSEMISADEDNRDIIQSILVYYTEALRAKFHEKLKEYGVEL